MQSMKSCVGFAAVLLLLADSAAAQTHGAASPSPAPGRAPSPSRADNILGDKQAIDATTHNGTTTSASGATRAAPNTKKVRHSSPLAAAERVPELRELNKLLAASPAMTTLLKDADLTATIFAPHNDAVKGGLEYLNNSFPNMTVKELGEMGIIDSLLQYHVTAGSTALTSARLKNGMKLTMRDGNPVTIIKMEVGTGTGARRRMLQAEVEFIRSNTNQSVPIIDEDYQSGNAIIHVIDGVLIPASLVDGYALTNIPGTSNAATEEPTPAAEEGAPTATPAASDSRGRADGVATTPATAPASKSSARAAIATLLAAPAMLVMLML